jgi:hypothetical protein
MLGNSGKDTREERRSRRLRRVNNVARETEEAEGENGGTETERKTEGKRQRMSYRRGNPEEETRERKKSNCTYMPQYR